MFQNPYGLMETAIYHTGRRTQAWEGSFLSSRHIVAFADSRDPRRRGYQRTLTLSCSVATSPHWDTLGGTGQHSRGDNSGWPWRFLPPFLPSGVRLAAFELEPGSLGARAPLCLNSSSFFWPL